jgi:hypothetical protein
VLDSPLRPRKPHPEESRTPALNSLKNTPAHRLVYSPHAYNIEGHNFSSFDELKQAYGARALFLLHSKPETLIWAGEFGACQTLDCGANSDWVKLFICLLKENPHISWSYWPLNGTQSSAPDGNTIRSKTTDCCRPTTSTSRRQKSWSFCE